MFDYRIGDAFGGVTVAVGVYGVRHALVGGGVIKQHLCVTDYIVTAHTMR